MLIVPEIPKFNILLNAEVSQESLRMFYFQYME